MRKYMICAALLAAGMAQTVYAEDITVTDESFFVNAYPDALMKLMRGETDLETAKNSEFHYIGDLSAQMTLSDPGNYLALLQDANENAMLAAVCDGSFTFYMDLKPDEDTVWTGEQYPSYQGSVVSLISLKDPKEAGLDLSFSDTQIDTEFSETENEPGNDAGAVDTEDTAEETGEAGTEEAAGSEETEEADAESKEAENASDAENAEEDYDDPKTIVTTVSEASGKPFWVFYRQVGGDESTSSGTREMFCYSGSDQIYDVLYGGEDPAGVSYEIEGVVPFEAVDFSYETMIGTWEENDEYGDRYYERVDQIQFDEPVTGVFMVAAEDSEYIQCHAVVNSNIIPVTVTSQSKPDEEEMTADSAEYRLVGFAEADVPVDYHFERTEDQTWEEIFVGWNEGTAQEVFDACAPYYVSDADVFEEESETEEDGAVYTDSETVTKVQNALNQAGYGCGTADGIAGDNTHSAMNKYQSDHGLDVTNDITDQLLKSLGI